MANTTLPDPADAALPDWIAARLVEPCTVCDGHGEWPTRDPQITVPCQACAGLGHQPIIIPEVLTRVSDRTICRILDQITAAAEAGRDPFTNRLNLYGWCEAHRRTTARAAR